MDNENTSLDKLFSKKFENFESQSSKADWEMLSTKLSKLNFLKFSFSTFNAYFMAAFVSFAVATTYLGVNNWNKSEEIEVLESRIDSLQKQVNEIAEIPFENNTTTSLYVTDTEKNEKLAISPIFKKESAEGGIIENQKSELSLKPVVLNDDSANVKNKQPVIANADSSVTSSKSKTPKIRKVKKTVKVKQDDVILKDTIVIKDK